MKKQILIDLITKHIESTQYKRNSNYETYSVNELLKVCYLYGIKV